MSISPETDVEVLKSELKGLKQSLSEVSIKMDLIIGIQMQMTGLQKDMEHHRVTSDRAFSSVEGLRARVMQTESSLLQMKSVVTGGLAVGVLLFGFAQWYVLGQLSLLEQMAKDTRKMDRRMYIMEQIINPRNKKAPADEL